MKKHMEKRSPPRKATVSPGGRPPEWVHVLAPLMEDPGEWYLISSYPSEQRKAATELASSFRRGRRITPPGRWEFTAQSVGDRVDVFARYLGGEN